MSLLTALSAVSSAKHRATVLFRRCAKESTMRSLRLPVKRRARLLVKESISNIYIKGNATVSLNFFDING